MKKIFVSYLLISFVFNFIWEISQVGLYNPHFDGFWDLIFVHLRATFGDVLIAFAIYVIVGLIFRDAYWVRKNKTISFVSASLLGFVFAVAIEKYALFTGRWGYNDLMPIIPYIGVGLSPVLQLTILSPLVALITGKYLKK